MKNTHSVITLCGSSSFREVFIETANKLTLQHYIVLTPSFGFGLESDLIVSHTLREILVSMHKQRIDMADEILVINKNGYIGDSTKAEIEYAKKNNKEINYLYYKCKKSTCKYKEECKEFEIPFCFRKPYALAVTEDKNVSALPICECYIECNN